MKWGWLILGGTLAFWPVPGGGLGRLGLAGDAPPGLLLAAIPVSPPPPPLRSRMAMTRMIPRRRTISAPAEETMMTVRRSLKADEVVAGLGVSFWSRRLLLRPLLATMPARSSSPVPLP